MKKAYVVAWLVGLIVVGVVLLSFLRRARPLREDFVIEGEGIIWTCTTFFDCPKKNKWDVFQKCIHSLRQLHSEEELSLITKWIVINEYSETHARDWEAMMKETYPFMEFIQKKEHERGQAKSLNLILSIIQPYKYWFQWEESWDTRSPFIRRAIDVMDANGDITQLQLTATNEYTHWMGRSDHVIIDQSRIHCNQDVCKIDLDSNGPSIIDENVDDLENNIDRLRHLVKRWPLYSLRPSINRVHFYTSMGVGNFSEKTELWPYLFELHYAVKWVKAGAIKAVLRDGPVIRQSDHVSTY